MSNNNLLLLLLCSSIFYLMIFSVTNARHIYHHRNSHKHGHKHVFSRSRNDNCGWRASSNDIPPYPVSEITLLPPLPPVSQSTFGPPPLPVSQLTYGPPPPVSHEDTLSPPPSPPISQTTFISRPPPPPPVFQTTFSTPPPPSSPPVSQTTFTPPPLSLAPAAEAPIDHAGIDDSTRSGVVLFDVRKYGAIGDGTSDDTEAFETAWDAACEVENATIFVPSHYTFMIQASTFTGPCQSGLVLKVEGTIVPPDGPDSWPKNVSNHQWLVFYRLQELSVQGGGMFDGKGQKWWQLPCKPHRGPNGTTLPGPCYSPIMIRFFESSNLTVKDLKIKDSPQFNFRFDQCENVHVESLFITAPATSPNTDGIHIENANNVKIYNSFVSNGDDCVSIGAGCHNVDIKNISCEHSHGISIGSLGNHNSKACVHNITVRDSLIRSSANGVRIKTWQGGSGSVSKITFSNIHMDKVRNPIIIDQFYCLSLQGCSNKTSAVFISDVIYDNIKGTYDVRGPPMHFGCSDTIPCANVTLSGVELLPDVGDQFVVDPFCWNVYGKMGLGGVIPPVVGCLEQGVPERVVYNNGLRTGCFWD